MTRPRLAPNNVILDWTEFGHHFQIEKLPRPDQKGRKYRLWDSGEPASGGQWHYTVSSAIGRAEYVTQGDYASRIKYLEQRVILLERDLYFHQQGGPCEQRHPVPSPQMAPLRRTWMLRLRRWFGMVHNLRRR